jgi:hypothetical protein
MLVQQNDWQLWKNAFRMQIGPKYWYRKMLQKNLNLLEKLTPMYYVIKAP